MTEADAGSQSNKVPPIVELERSAINLDYLCLIISSFFLQDVLDENHVLSQPNPSLLWLYFTSRGLRNCMYLGMACRVGFNALFRVGNRGFTARNCFFVGLFSYTAVKNISWSIQNTLQQSSASSSFIGNWFTSGHLGGSWFLGAGNGEWYAFLGHNSPEETQVLPQMILEQLKRYPNSSNFTKQDDGEHKDPTENAPSPNPKLEEIFDENAT